MKAPRGIEPGLLTEEARCFLTVVRTRLHWEHWLSSHFHSLCNKAKFDSRRAQLSRHRFHALPVDTGYDRPNCDGNKRRRGKEND